MQSGHGKVILMLATWLGWEAVAPTIVSMCQAKAAPMLKKSRGLHQPCAVLDELLLLASKPSTP